MSTLAEIETAIQQLSPEERAELARWWQESFDPDEGLKLRPEFVLELVAARKEAQQGEVIF